MSAEEDENVGANIESVVETGVMDRHSKWPELRKIIFDFFGTTIFVLPSALHICLLSSFESDHLQDLFSVGLFSARERNPLAQYLLLLI